MSQVTSLRSQVSKIARLGCFLNIIVIVIVYFGQFMSPHNSEQMSHRSHVLVFVFVLNDFDTDGGFNKYVLLLLTISILVVL